MQKVVVLSAAILGFSAMMAGQETAPKDANSSIFVEAVPKTAKEVRPDVYRQEEAGKQIIYVRTPFGVTRREQTESMRKVIEDGPPMGITAKEHGDQYLFERRTPFGLAKWTKKKDSQEKLDLLTAEEKDALAYTKRLIEEAAAAAKGEKPKP